VLELGSQLSKVSEKICEKALSTNEDDEGRVILMDVERKDASSGRNKERNLPKYEYYRRSFDEQGGITMRGVSFIELKDGLSEWTKSLYSSSKLQESDEDKSKRYPQHFDVLVMDVATMTGNDLLLKTISIIQTFLDHHKQIGYEPRCIIVKSGAMTNLSRRLYHAQRVMDGTSSISEEIVRSHEPLLFASVGVNEYRQMIPYSVRKGDEVVEVGCHVGTSTTKIHDAAYSEEGGYCIGIDNGSKIIALAKKSHGERIPFFVGDAWRTGEINRCKDANVVKNLGLNSSGSNGYDVVFVDIGGLSGPDGLLESISLLQSIGMALEPRAIVIKSLCMRRLASSLRPFHSIWQQQYVS